MPWRLLVTAPLDGATNMAIDEALLRARIDGRGPPTVRFYGWAEATVSLGYAQPLAAGVDWAACRRLGIGRVRRPTGGSAILHEPLAAEVTYCVVARGADFPGADDVLETYRIIGTGLAIGLRGLGVPAVVAPLVRRRRPGPAAGACFARTGAYELVVGEGKLAGSAQRRQAGAFLQHGSLLLDADPARLRAVFADGDHAAATLTTVRAARGRPLAFDDAVSALAPALGDALGGRLEPGGLSEAETALVEALVRDKYDTEAWTARAETPGAAPAAAGAPR